MTYIKRRYNPKKLSFRRRKRWYFQAGANLPFLGKTTVGFGTTKGKRSLKNIVKNVVRNQMEESKHITFYANQTQTHNTIYTLNPLGTITNSTSSSGMIGDSIFLSGLKIKLYLEQDNTFVQNSHVRFMIVEHDADYLSGGTNWGSGLGSSELFQPNTATTITLNGLHNAKLVNVLFDKTYGFTKDQATGAKSKIADIFLKLNKKFTFKTGTGYGKFRNLYFVTIGHVPGGTTGTSVTNYINISTDLIFKDE